MLAIRLQRIGRRGHAQFRVVVQDSRWSPKSGKYVALLGSYNPHAKTNTLVKDQAQTFLNNGAQPSERVAKLFKEEGIKLPKWVTVNKKKAGKAKNPEKLRKNQPAEAKTEEPKEAAERVDAEAVVEETPAENTEQKPKTQEPESETLEEVESPKEESAAEPAPEAENK